MRAAVLVVVVLALAGCSTLDRAMENRVLCSLDRQQMAVISWWGGWGVGAKVAAADAAVACHQAVGNFSTK